MKYNYYGIAILAILFLGHKSYTQGVLFENVAWSEARMQTSGYIFVDAYAEWCIPCKKMEKEVFALDSVGAFMNAKAHAYKFDIDTEKGKEFSREYAVEVLPTYFIFDSAGTLLNKQFGYKSTDVFLEWVYQYMAPEKSQVLNVLKQWNAGEIEQDSVLKHLVAFQKKAVPTDSLAHVFLRKITESDLLDKNVRLVFFLYQPDFFNGISQYYMHNPDIFYEGEEDIFVMKVAQLANHYIRKFPQSEQEVVLQTIRENLSPFIVKKKIVQKINAKVKGLKL